MTTTPCPGGGMPRAADLADQPCPLCGPVVAAALGPAPPPPPEPPPPEPPAPPAPDRRWLVAAFVLVAVFAGGAGFWGGRASAPKPAPEIVEAPPPAPQPVAPPPARPPSPATKPSPPPAPPRDYPKVETSKSRGLTLALIPAGSFLMGSWEHETGRLGEEVEHAVKITRPFYLGAHEVTQTEFEAVMGHNPSWFSKTGGGSGQVVTVVDGTGRFPVERATWFDAVEFCNRLSTADGHEPYYRITNVKREENTIVAAEVEQLGGTGYRLPTEAEWEYACRAGSKGVFHFGRENSGTEANVKATVVASGYGSAPKWKAGFAHHSPF